MKIVVGRKEENDVGGGKGDEVVVIRYVCSFH